MLLKITQHKNWYGATICDLKFLRFFLSLRQLLLSLRIFYASFYFEKFTLLMEIFFIYFCVKQRISSTHLGDDLFFFVYLFGSSLAGEINGAMIKYCAYIECSLLSNESPYSKMQQKKIYILLHDEKRRHAKFKCEKITL